ncbi:MAG: 1,4-alpha-glucan branching protein GlgB [Sumerlaeia bacterium]
MPTPSPEQLDLLVGGDHWDPHAILGIHPHRDDEGGEFLTFRTYHPDAKSAELIVEGVKDPLVMQRMHQGGVFAIDVEARKIPHPFRYKYRLTFKNGSTWEREDPYRFRPTFGDLDMYLASEGRHWRIFDKMGAQVRTVDGVKGVSFAVWAPNAKRVSVVGDFNYWDGRLCPMRILGNTGIWELFIPGLGENAIYKFEIKTQQGHILLKLDPYAFKTQMRPETAALTHRLGQYKWDDQSWMGNRSTKQWLNEPMAVYEIHMGSWMRSPDDPEKFLGYRDVAQKLVDHCKRYHFNFVEFMPLAEHPFDGSWGYQVTGYYAPTARFGTPDEFKYMVDLLHQNDIGVIVDWVPAHFPKDAHGLREFDGTALYEHADPRKGEHKDWGTLIFNYGRNEVRNFLIANALFWLKEYHIDGLRVDAVASMLYLDYSRKEGEWVPNKFGGRENLEAIDFLRSLNEEVHGQFPGAFTVAEESTSFGGVSRPTFLGGLGFTFKWNMGWMNDSLSFFSKEPIHRSYHHNELTFSMIYSYSENFMLPISHDEVVHGKGSLLGKMPGDEWQKFANYRMFLGYMWTHPGKKLLYMGQEFAQGREWKHDLSLDWHEAGHPSRKGVENFMADLGKLYHSEPALWRFDHEERGFNWIEANDHMSSVLSFIRWGDDGDHLVVIINMTPVTRHDYRLGVPWPCYYEEVLNSDSAHYGGSNQGNSGGVQADHWAMHGHYHSINLSLPPLSTMIFKARR